MFSAWEGPEIATFWLAIAAILISSASVWYTRRQSRAAEGALKLEKQREVERTRPQTRLSFSGWITEPVMATFILENRGTRTVDHAQIRVLTGDDETRLVGFGDDTELADREREFGPLEPGVPMKTTFLIAEDVDNVVVVLATYTVDADRWTERAEVELPRPGPAVF